METRAFYWIPWISPNGQQKGTAVVIATDPVEAENTLRDDLGHDFWVGAASAASDIPSDVVPRSELQTTPVRAWKRAA